MFPLTTRARAFVLALTLGALTMPALAQSVPADFTALQATEGSAMTPRISTAMLLSAPENADLRALILQPRRPPATGVVATDGVEEIELTATLGFFRARGATVHLIAPPRPSYPAHFGVQIPEVRETHILTIRYMENGGWVRFDRTIDQARAADYDAVIIPGGAWNPDTLRADQAVLGFVRSMAAANKPVAAICHGPWVLGDAGLLQGRRATSWWSMQRDIAGAGGTFVDAPVVVDRNVITSRAPIDLPEFLRAVGEAVAARRG